MSFIKSVIEIILFTIIFFFVWNILKRIFFTAFYKNFPGLKPSQHKTNEKKSKKEKINWDAETVEYEEISEKEKP